MPAASKPEPEPGDDGLAAVTAALTEADIPPDDADWAALDDPDAGRPAELAGLSFAELAELMAAIPALVTGPIPAGCLPRDGTGCGAGFGDGGPLDTLPPGVVLAGFADDAHGRLAAVTDDELIGVLRAWWRQASWAQARALAAIGELARRRPADRTPAAAPGQFPAKLSEFLADEVAMALTLTQPAAETQVGLALQLAVRPATAAALEAGRIDLRKALVILDAILLLSDEHAAAAEAQVLPDAPGQTTGELRQAVKKAILALDPDAVRRRRQEAEKRARVEAWTDPDGTATLSGRCLPPAEVLAADKRLCQVAAYWKKLIRAAWKHADPVLPRPEHGMDLLRAKAYLALLLGQPLEAPPADLLPPVPDSESRPGHDHAAPGGAGGQHVPAGLRRPGPAPLAHSSDSVAGLPPMPGLISLTLPLTTFLGVSDRPGEAAGYGPLHADTARLIACALAGHRATRWQIILTDPDGHALAAGTARGNPGSAGGGWTVKVTAEPIATSHCDHRNQEPGHDPSPALQRLVRARTGACIGPGCRRGAGRCDLDHSLAYDDGGITCECGIGPGCRRCHRRKQALQWALAQPSPGVMIWTSPAGRRYVTYPSKHPT